MFKKYLTKSNILTLVLIAIVLSLQIPRWLSNLKVENKSVNNIRVDNINTDQEQLVDKSQKYIFFFWASWCAPCKVEMYRYKKSINEGLIPKENFWAINPFETLGVVKNFIKKNNYPFTFVHDQGSLAKQLQVTATPTVTFIDNGTVLRQSSGISVIGIYRAQWFFE